MLAIGKLINIIVGKNGPRGDLEPAYALSLDRRRGDSHPQSCQDRIVPQQILDSFVSHKTI